MRSREDGAESAEHHAATSPRMNLPWVESPFFEREIALREDSMPKEVLGLAKQYHEQGYVALEQLVPHEICDRVRLQLEQVFDEDDMVVQHRRAQDAWKRGADAVLELATLAPVCEMLSMLYERKPIPFQTLGFKWGTQQGGHSDSIHFSSLPARYMCGVWVALEDTGPENGPLFYYPGSQRLPEFNAFDLGQRFDGPGDDFPAFFKTLDSFQHELEDLQRALMRELEIEPIEFHAKKGDALLWSSNVVHGGQQVIALDSTRWSQVTHYFFEDCIYYAPLWSDTVAGELFLKEVVDLSTMHVVPHTYNGSPVTIDHLSNGRSRISVASERSDSSSEAVLRAELTKTAAEAERLRTSPSYRLGNTLLKPFRAARRLVAPTERQ
jgi:hypothetical protein